jgi:uncharacterized protein (DUF983 family)
VLAKGAADGSGCWVPAVLFANCVGLEADHSAALWDRSANLYYQIVDPRIQLVSTPSAIWHELCPRCRQGPLFRGPIYREWLAMFERCPVCGLKLEREQGYFLGAMYVSYGLSILPVLLLVLVIWRITGWPYDVSIGVAFVAYLPFVPVVTRFARVLWMYIDQAIDPR